MSKSLQKHCGLKHFRFGRSALEVAIDALERQQSRTKASWIKAKLGHESDLSWKKQAQEQHLRSQGCGHESELSWKKYAQEHHKDVVTRAKCHGESELRSII